MNDAPLGWLSIVRLGLVQSSLGAIVMLTTSILNRVMVVEYVLPAVLPAGLVAWHYAVQLSRPRWGHGSDVGNRRTPWIIGGMGVLAIGGLLATNAVFVIAASPVAGVLLAVLAFTMIGAGVGASGTSLLALLATHVAPERRPAAAALTWIMMIAGIVVTSAIASTQLDPFSPQRLANVAGCVALGAFLVTLMAVRGVERRPVPSAEVQAAASPDFGAAIREVWNDAQARHFTIFVFISMLAYSTQDLILEPFAGLIFDYSVGESTRLSSFQNMGVLIGMIVVGVGGSAFAGTGSANRGVARRSMRGWVVGGCIGSALALAGLGFAATAGPGWPLAANVFVLGFANGVFAVAAIASMMDLAGAGKTSREGIRMGLWGAAQAIAFGLGSFLGAAGLDAGRALFGSVPIAFVAVFACEALLFLVAARLGFGIAPARVAGPVAQLREVPA